MLKHPVSMGNINRLQKTHQVILLVFNYAITYAITSIKPTLYVHLFTQVRNAGKVTLNLQGTGRGTLAVRFFFFLQFTLLMIYDVSVNAILNDFLLITDCADIQNYEEG